jgi:hypothetical protein
MISKAPKMMQQFLIGDYRRVIGDFDRLRVSVQVVIGGINGAAARVTNLSAGDPGQRREIPLRSPESP